jgi:hypothetical protein
MGQSGVEVRFMTRSQGWAAVLVAAALAAGCSDNDSFTADGAAGATGASQGPGANELAACEPLGAEQQPISLGTVVAVGQADDGTVFMVDQLDVETRVFVSSGNELVRVRVNGTGESTDGGEEAYTQTFDAPTGGSWTLGTEIRDGTTRMALVREGQHRTFADVLAAGEELTVLEESALDDFVLVNLPGEIEVEYFARTENGEQIVVTRPRDDWSYEDFRLFYGTSVLAERQVLDVTRLRDGGTTTLVFELDGTEASALFPASLDGTPNAPTLTIGDVVLTLTEIESEAKLETLQFECLTS